LWRLILPVVGVTGFGILSSTVFGGFFETLAIVE
jgi:hypothetical protein